MCEQMDVDFLILNIFLLRKDLLCATVAIFVEKECHSESNICFVLTFRKICKIV